MRDKRHDRERIGGEGWRRGRVSGGFGSQFDAWSSGAGQPAAGFGFGPDEHPEPDHARDRYWAPPPSVRRPDGAAAEDYRGRGPRDYRRSDERVRDEVCERLTDDSSVDASDITVAVSDGEVTLTGTVRSREQKRRAGECAERVAGVHDVFNQLRLAGPTTR